MVQHNIELFESHICTHPDDFRMFDLVTNIFARVALPKFRSVSTSEIFDRFWDSRVNPERNSEILHRIEHFGKLDVLTVFSAVRRDPEMRYITYRSVPYATCPTFSASL